MLLKLAWRNIWRNRKRSLITILAIFIAVFLAIVMRSLQLGMYDNMIGNVVSSFSGYVQVHSAGYWDEKVVDNSFVLDQELVEKVSAVEGVKNTLQRIQSGSLASNEDLSKFVFITGIEPENEKLLTNWEKRLIEGELLTNESKTINIGKGIAKYFSLKIGDTLVFIGQGYHGMQAVGAYPISGILDMKNPTLNNISVFMTLPMSQEFLSAENNITHLIIDKKKYGDERAIAEGLSAALDENYEVMTWQEMMPELEQTIQADSAGGLIMVFILYMIITFGIFGTVLMMTQERQYEFGVMVSIGMKKLKLIITMVYETVFLTSIGVLAGVLISRPLVLYFHYNPMKFPEEQARVMEEFGFEAIIPWMSSYDIPLTHGLIIFCISVVISLYPAINILYLNPIKAMKR
ncbi:MAG TPA: ABC transporter permease [Flavobacteriales bacterium]|nr:ABC transporter permease [Flavobacteriales bacterium]HIN38924.1 ABC transporter permease [Flavobacteriales bacterium]